MNRDQFWLTEDQFSRLAPLLPTDTRCKPRVDDRRVISGIVHVLKSGGRWVDAPDVYGPYKTLYNRFVRWAAKGIWVDCPSSNALRQMAVCELQGVTGSSSFSLCGFLLMLQATFLDCVP